MIRSKIKITNKLGLHARAAAKFAKCASQFSSTVEIGNKERMVNGKSIMSVMTLAAGRGTTLQLIITGGDEEAANSELTKLVKSYFGEKN